ncbi:hypothetical protein RDI58_021844 [Solanum bulbocastanum]|uniref:Uncharacterized protein n=1 Tax=Solanum bulbocastanum TaxID=147425 RepID=A0AAN8T0Z7_SOLBU
MSSIFILKLLLKLNFKPNFLTLIGKLIFGTLLVKKGLDIS